MGRILVIVESPGKIAKLQKFLGDDYVVMASAGHIMDLHKSDLSIDINNNFTPTYYADPKKEKLISDLRKAYKSCDNVIIATDRDREGEMIGWCLADALKVKNPDRIVFTEITKEEILKAINEKGKLNQDLIDAAKARRVLDRLMGWELSPLISTQLGNMKLSAGRVQSVIVRLIVDKEQEIKNFFNNDFHSSFKFSGELMKQKIILKSTLHDITTNKKNVIQTNKITQTNDINLARGIMESLSNSIYIVTDISAAPSIRQPSPPFTTNSLQQVASQRLGMKPGTTMSAAQRLYEAGHITYMRTDSVNLSSEILGMSKKYIFNNFGEKYHRLRVYKAKTSNAQEAHEAIRPTNLNVEFVDKLGNAEQRLYQLIWRRTVASQMAPAEFEVTTVQIGISKLPNNLMKSSSEVLMFDGYLKVYGIENDEDLTLNKSELPKLDDKLNILSLLGKEDYEKPPARYNYASLVKILDPDNLNIGRPATYASIIDAITKKQYVSITDIPGIDKQAVRINYNKNTMTETTEIISIGKEKERFVPNNIGELITNYLIEHFGDFVEYKFTAGMEELLDDISNGKVSWDQVIGDFYKKFHPKIIEMKNTKIVTEDKNLRKLGVHPKTGLDVFATIKIYGAVVMTQIAGTKKTNYASISQPLTIENITLDDAVKLLRFPKLLGKIGRCSVYLKNSAHGLYVTISTKDKINIPDGLDENDITVDKVKELLEQRAANSLGEFVNKTKKYTILKGKFNEKKQKQMSDYIKMIDGKKKYNIPIPKDTDLKSLTLESVEKIIEDFYNKKRAPRKTVGKKPIKKVAK